jgi:hypothetical protein
VLSRSSHAGAHSSRPCSILAVDMNIAVMRWKVVFDATAGGCTQRKYKASFCTLGARLNVQYEVIKPTERGPDVDPLALFITKVAYHRVSHRKNHADTAGLCKKCVSNQPMTENSCGRSV